MKKLSHIILFSFLILGGCSTQKLSNPSFVLNSDPSFIEEFAFAFNADRDPTATEPVVDSYGIPTNWLFPWYNTATLDVYDYKGGSNGSYVWQKRITDANISNYIPPAQIQSDWTQTNSLAVDFIKNKPAARSFSYITRSLNTAFQISTIRDAAVTYSVDIAATLSLTSGQSGTVFLEIADNSSFTVNVQEVTRFVNGNTGSLTIGLNLTQNVTGTLSGIIPANKWVRLRTANNTGTPTFTSRPGQETLL